jgi:transposase
MRFVAMKSAEAQASAAMFRARDLLVRQRTQHINAIRGHLMEHGLVVGRGPAHLPRRVALVEESDHRLPATARAMIEVLVDRLSLLDERIARLDQEIRRRACEEDKPARLMTIPGIGPITAIALAALAPPAETFRKGRDLAAGVGLTPLQRSTGGKQKLGAISRMGERTLRRLLIVGASAVVRHASRRDLPASSWLARMLARKPRMLVIVALANKMARIAWALLARNEVYRAPTVAA